MEQEYYVPECTASYQGNTEQRLSVAEKLYDMITVAPRLGNERIKTVWNLENRISSVMRTLGFIGTTRDQNPTYQADLETLTRCVEALEKKAASDYWKKVYSKENRSLKEADVRNTIASLKSYIGAEALKKGKRYNRTTNKIESRPQARLVPEPKRSMLSKISYI